MPTILQRLVARKPIKDIQSDAHGADYKRELNWWDLVSIGVGGIIGAGIFVLTGRAARENAGPGIVISYVIAGVVSALASLCYAELASSLPVSGSAYSFSYATMGELVGWIIGWDLMLEYLVGGATVAVGWAAYLEVSDGVFTGQNATVGGFYLNCVNYPSGSDTFVTPILNLPALIISGLCTALLIFGIKETAQVNNFMVVTKLLVVLIVIFAGIKFVNPANYTPFIPPNAGVPAKFGISGVMTGAVSVFFAYIGFDSVSTVAQESKNPQRDLPIGIIGSLVVCTALYIAVSLIITGMVPYQQIDPSHAVAEAFSQNGLPGLALLIGIGALTGLTSVLLNLMIGQPRIFQTMANDGLFPSTFAKISKRGTPYTSTMTTGVICAVLSALLPVDVLGNLTSIGTLFAFAVVSLSTLVLRVTNPDLERKFKIPGPQWFGGYFIPLLSFVASVGLMTQSTVASVLRIFIWMGIGLVVYFAYGYRNSKLGKQLAGEVPEVK
ncbi:amino acid/polyamine transporter I, partial [Gorgonomyces haynaldii]